MDLMAAYEVPATQLTIEELDAELTRWRKRRESTP